MINKACETDHPRLCEIWESAVKATHSFLNEEDFNFYKSQIPEYLNNLNLYTYKDPKGEIKGFLGVHEDKIEMLFIDSQARGQGIGKKLFEYAVNTLKATKLDVNEQNGQAVGFYKHLGFKLVGRSEKDGEGKNYPLLHLEKDSAHKQKPKMKLR